MKVSDMKSDFRDFTAWAKAHTVSLVHGRVYIGLCGRAQHGKSSLCRDLSIYLNQSGRPCRITAFATVVKDMLRVFGLNHEQLYGSEKATPSPILGGKTPRFAMQTIATEWGRKMLYDEVWVDAWLREVNKDTASKIVLIEDVRHGPEIEVLHSLGAILIEVYRPALMPSTPWGWAKHWFKSLRQHSSEKLDFAEYGIPRIIVEEGRPDLTLKKFLEMFPQLK